MARDLKLQVLLNGIDKVTGPLKKITKGSGKTAEALKASRDELKHLERAQKDMRSFRQLKQQSTASADALKTQQEEIKQLSRHIGQAEGPVDKLTRAREKAIKKARKLKEQYEDEQRKLRQLRSSMTRVEGVTGNYSDQQRELTRRIRQANQQLENQQRQLSETARRQRKAADAAKRYQKAQGRAGTLAGTGAGMIAGGGGALALMTTQAFGNEMAGSRLAAQLGEGKEASAAYREVTTNVYAGGRGTGLDEVERAVSMTAAAFGSLEDQSAAQLEAITAQALTLSDVFGVDIAEAVQTASIMVQNGLAKNASGAFDLMGRSFQEVPAAMRDELPEILHEYSTNFRALGFDGKESMNILVAAAGQGKFALDKTGDALKEFAIRGSDMSKTSVEAYEAVGLDAEKMSNAIASGGDDAHKAMMKTVKAILAIENPAERANTAIALFGTPLEDLSIDQIPKFLRALGGTKDLLGEVSGATAEMADTLDHNAGKSLINIQRAISGAFMQVLTEVQDEIIAVSKAVTGWIKENPQLASTIAKAAAAIAALVAVGGTLMAVLGSILGPIAMVRYALMLLSLNPVSLTIMAIVAAVAALAAGAYFLYKNWGAISDWFSARWQDIKTAFSGGISGVLDLLISWNPLSLLYKGIIAGLEAMGISVPEKFKTLGSAIMDGIVGGITAKLSAVKDAIVNVGAKVTGWFKEKLGINSPSRVFAEFGDNTMAGYQQGLKSGENGPLKQVSAFSKRLKQTGAGLAIGAASMGVAADIPLDTRPPISASAGSGITINGGINISVQPTPGMDEQALARYVGAEVQRALAEAQREAAARSRSAFYDTE